MRKIKLHISPGNIKIGRIPNFSLPPKKACPNHRYCTQESEGLECYAVKAYRQYQNVRTAWDENFEIAKKHILQFQTEMEEFLNHTNKDVFRIHVSGDFFSQRYLDCWKKIAANLPSIRFLAFTKSFHLDYSNTPENLVVVWSVMPNMPMPRKKGPRAYCGGLPKTNRHKIVGCPGDCEKCKTCWYLKPNEARHFAIH